MATFSPLPQVPDAPSYLGYSKSVDAGSADTSAGQLFGQTASLVKEVTGAVDDLFKKEIDTGVREATERVQSAQGVPEAVATVKSGQGIFRKPGMVNDDGTAIATPDGADPGFVRQVDKSASDMTSQRDAYYAGKRSQSYYLASLEAESRRLTAQNPAYADYIQERFGAIAGVKPANALVASLRADLDAADRANKSAENSYEKWLQKPDTMKHLSPENYELAVRKEISPGRLQQMIQVSVAHEYNLDRLAKEQSTNKGTREAVESETEKGVMIGETGHFQKELSGLYENFRYRALMNKMQKGGTLTPDEKMEAQTVANTWAANTVNRWSSSLTQVRRDPTVPPGSQESVPEYAIYQQLGNSKFQESLKRMEDRVAGFMKNINDPKTGLMNQDKTNYELRMNDSKLGLSKIPGLMDAVAMGEMGEYGKGVVTKLMEKDLGVGVDHANALADRIRQQKLKETPKPAFNPQDPETKAGTNEVYDAVTVQKRTGLSELDQKRTLKRMLEDNPKDLAAPNLSDKERVNLFHYSFGDKSNRAVSDMMATPAQKQKMFQMYADPKVTANAEKIKESNPELYQQYRDYIDTRAKKYYSEDGLNMKKMVENPNHPYTIVFSQENNRFTFTRKDKSFAGSSGSELGVRETVNNMNAMLRVVEPTIDGGKPTSGRLLEFMKNVYGIDFNPQTHQAPAKTPELPPLRPGTAPQPLERRSDIGDPIDLTTKTVTQIASTFTGMTETANRSTLSAFISKGVGKSVDPVKQAWCADFANAVLAESGEVGTGSSAARSFLKYGKTVEKPVEGDIVVLTRGPANGPYGHVGFVQGIVDHGGEKYVKVLAGNQGAKGSVSVQEFPISRVLGYRRVKAKDVEEFAG